MKAERRAKLGQLLVDKGPKSLTERQREKLQENPEDLQDLIDKWRLKNITYTHHKKYQLPEPEFSELEVSYLNKVMQQNNKDRYGLSIFEREKIIPIIPILLHNNLLKTDVQVI